MWTMNADGSNRVQATEHAGGISGFGDARGGRFASDSYCVEVVVGVVFSEILVGHSE